MKKVISAFLAIMMVLSLSSLALAADLTSTGDYAAFIEDYTKVDFTSQSAQILGNDSNADKIGKDDGTGVWFATVDGIDWYFANTKTIVIRFNADFKGQYDTVVIKAGDQYMEYYFNISLNAGKYIVLSSELTVGNGNGGTNIADISHVSFKLTGGWVSGDDAMLAIKKDLGVYVDDSITSAGTGLNTIVTSTKNGKTTKLTENWFEYSLPINVDALKTDVLFTRDLIAGRDRKVVGTYTVELTALGAMKVSYTLKDGLTAKDAMALEIVTDPSKFTTASPGQLSFMNTDVAANTITISQADWQARVGTSSDMYVYLHLGAIGVMDVGAYDKLYAYKPFQVQITGIDVVYSNIVNVYAGWLCEATLFESGTYSVIEIIPAGAEYALYSGAGEYVVTVGEVTSVTLVNGLDAVPVMPK